MVSLNITNLLKHLDELSILLDFDLLAINKTRLYEDISEQDVQVEGCDLIN